MTTVFSPKMHWARESVFQMLSVFAGKPLLIGHVGGKTSFDARSRTIDRRVVWYVVGACSLVDTFAPVSPTVSPSVGAVSSVATNSVVVVSRGGRVSTGGSVLLADVPMVAGARGVSSSGRVGSAGVVDVMAEITL